MEPPPPTSQQKPPPSPAAKLANPILDALSISAPLQSPNPRQPTKLCLRSSDAVIEKKPQPNKPKENPSPLLRQPKMRQPANSSPTRRWPPMTSAMALNRRMRRPQTAPLQAFCSPRLDALASNLSFHNRQGGVGALLSGFRCLTASFHASFRIQSSPQNTRQPTKLSFLLQLARREGVLVG